MTKQVLTKNGLILGNLVSYPDGWRFLPQTDAHKPSRKAWPTPEAAIPRWARNLMDKIQTKAYPLF